MRYPPDSEHEYLSWFISQQHQQAEQQQVEPLRDRYWQAYCDGDREGAERLWNEANNTHLALVEQTRRKEDMVYWLYLDQELRQEGKTYPDTYEQCGWTEPTAKEEF